jgi:hypothetical protein
VPEEKPVIGRPFERGNQAAATHGLTSQARIVPQARNHKRRVLRSLGIRMADLDPVGKAFLQNYLRVEAKLTLADRYLEEHGMIRDGGEPQPVMRLYVALANSSRLALQRLEQHLHERDQGGELLALEAEGRRLRLAAGDERE